jgi:hypothetical protein
MERFLVTLNNTSGIRILKELEDLNVLHISRLQDVPEKKVRKSGSRLSDKYRGVLSKKDGASLDKHIKQMRNEWSNS